MVAINRSTLWDKKQTGNSMYSLAAAFHGDVRPLSALSLPQYFDRVKNIPYRRDPKNLEVTARPGYLLNNFPALDCKKKAILMGSYFEEHGIPYRFIACSQRPDRNIHHVFTQAKIGGVWKNVDPTYAKYKLFEPKRLTRSEVLTKGGSPMNVEGLAGAQLVQMYGESMGWSIGKALRKAGGVIKRNVGNVAVAATAIPTGGLSLLAKKGVRDRVGQAARFTQTNILRPGAGAGLTVARSSAGQALLKNALNMAPGGGLALDLLTKKTRTPGLLPERKTTPPMRRPGAGTSRPRGGTSPTEASTPGISMPWIIGGGVAGLGLLALAMRGGGRSGSKG